MLRVRLSVRRTLLLCVLGALAVGAAIPATSSALLAQPVFGRCASVAPGTGEYAVSTCTGGKKVSGGNFDFQALVKNHFVGAAGVTVLETVGAVKVECKNIAVIGEYGEDEEIFTSIRLTGCKYTKEVPPLPCRNAGAEEIVLTPLPLNAETGFVHNFVNKEGKLIVAAGLEVGFEGEGPEGHSVKFECGTPHQFLLSGIAIAAAGPIDTNALSAKVSLKQSKGKQTPGRFEGGAKVSPILQQTFPLMPPEQAGLAAAWTQKNEEPVELKAVE